MAEEVNNLYFMVTNNPLDGLVEYPEKFDEDYNHTGFLITTAECAHYFYENGDNLRVVELPFNDPDFRMVQPKFSLNHRVNKLILKEKYPLSDVMTYLKFNLKFPTFAYLGKHGYLSIIIYLINENRATDGDKYRALVEAAEFGYLDIVKYIIESGINRRNSDIMCCAARSGHLDIVKYLFEKAPHRNTIINTSGKINVHIYDNYALRTSLAKDYMDLVCYLVEKGARIDPF